MIRRAILQTLTYSDHFGFPLTFSEIRARLIGVKTNQVQLRAQLQLMLKRGVIGQTGQFYHLRSRSPLVARRLRRAHSSLPLRSRAQQLALHLARIPGVLAIYLTGSLAMSNSSSGSDIDFMIIAHPGRLWTTRLLLTLYTSLRGWRRSPHSRSHSGQLCLNLFLTPTSYLLPESRRSLYTAYELVQAVPLYDPHDTHAALLSANSWLRTYLPNFPLSAHRAQKRTRNASRHKVVWEASAFFEHIAYFVQKLYMHRKITREYISLDAAFFHPRDPGRSVITKLTLLK